MTRLLGIDLGERRVGLAIGDDDGSTRRPHSTLRRGGDLDADARALAAVIEAEAVDALVIGLPLGHPATKVPRRRSRGPGARRWQNAWVFA